MSDTTPPSSPGPLPEPPRRRLERSSSDRVIGGVCGGLARYFDIDPVIVRIAAVALMFIGGITAVAYLAAMIFVPRDDAVSGEDRPLGRRILAFSGIVVLACAAVVGTGSLTSGVFWDFGGEVIGLVLIALVLALGARALLQREGKSTETSKIIAVSMYLVAGVIGAGVLAAGAAWATAAGGGTVVAAIVVALGVAMVVGAFSGYGRWLALPALLIALPAGTVAAAGIEFDGPVGETTHRPVTLAELPSDGYRMSMGEMVIDLRRLQWPDGEPVHVKLRAGVGHAVVYVPSDVCVRADARTGAGYIGILGTEDSGFDVRARHGAPLPSVTPSLILDADMGVGAIEVRHRGTAFAREDGPGRRDDEDSGDNAISERLAQAGCAGEVG